MQLNLRLSAYGAAVALFVLLVALIRPWGDYPVNDDWQYARVAKRYAETQRILIDVPIAPSLVGQAVLVAPLIRAFGFSHPLLRLTTILFSLVLLYAIDRLLAIAALGWEERFLALGAIVVNPLFVNLSLSFMTEVYGYVPAMLGAWVWFRERQRQEAAEARDALPIQAPVRIWPAAAAGILCGASFWVRQYAVLVLPALWAGACLRFACDRRWRSFRSLAFPIGASLATAALVVAGYFIWAQDASSLRPEFKEPLAKLTHLDPRAWAAESGPFVIFLSLSCLPILILVLGLRCRIGWRHVMTGIAIAGGCTASALLFRAMVRASPRLDSCMGHHSSFPFVGNIFSEFGIGPVTLADVYMAGAPGRPRWIGLIWTGLVMVAICSSALWALFLKDKNSSDNGGAAIRRELFGFAVALSLISFGAAVQTYGLLMFDRYYFPSILGMIMAAATRLLPEADGRGVPGSAAQPARCAPRLAFTFALGALIGLGVLTAAGVHNYFRWNDARWALYGRAMARGLDPRTVEGGYEIQGWRTLDLLSSPMDSSRCIGPCSCDYGWYCLDNSYQITMNPRPSYEIADAIQPDYWLAAGPPVLLLQRASQNKNK